ncbi:MAG: D-alanyl-D-alanine carboxypeptidase, partial [Nitratireductor sp.]|nr:D-alanyl-D-alanine carboxypeptidase [Nitratireductor sp.]
MDGRTGQQIHAQNADTPLHPASLTKMMTLYLAFAAVEQGRVRLDSRFTVSEHAASQPPSKLGLKAGQSIPVDTAIRVLVVKSANDVATAVGEFLGGGSESRFAEMMTAKAHELGMTRTTFKNASGLPDPGQVTTATDLARLSIALR